MKEQIRIVCSRLRVALLAGALLVAGASLAFNRIGAAQDGPKGPPLNVVVDNSPIERDGRMPASFAPVVKEVTPSVVKVFTTTRVRQPANSDWPFFDDPMFRRFFGDQFRMERRQNQPQERKQFGLGSGVIVSENGYVLSNNHVVQDADEIKVALADGREFDAKVVGTDPKTEVAVLRIEATGLPYVKLGDSEKIEVGDFVLAVGNPFGIGQTVTMGMVSAKGRATRELGAMGLAYQDFIQTDASINPGNSGGALVDLKGRLVGINTAILSRSGGNLGIGFAIPINLARSVMENLIEHGRVVRGFLGVRPQALTPELAAQFRLKDASGAVVTEVVPDSPADQAGIRVGDVITEFQDKPVKDDNQLRLEVGQTPPGTKVDVKVLRDGKAKTLQLTLQELPEEEIAAQTERPRDRDEERLRGVIVGDLDGNARSQFNIPRNVQGALVMEVDPSSPAYEAGLRPGDVIQNIDQQPVRNAEDAVALSEKIEQDKILLRVWSRGGSRFVVVDEREAG